MENQIKKTHDVLVKVDGNWKPFMDGTLKDCELIAGFMELGAPAKGMVKIEKKPDNPAEQKEQKNERTG